MGVAQVIGGTIALGLIGASLSQMLCSESGPIGGVFAGIVGNLAGDVSYDLSRAAVHDLRERAASGQLQPNHDVLRACWRSACNASLMLTADFQRQYSRGSPQWVWCRDVQSWLRAEIVGSKIVKNVPSMGTAAEHDALLGYLNAPRSDATLRAMQAELVDALFGAIEGWHLREQAAKGLLIPQHFKARFSAGWPAVEKKPHPAGGVWRVLNRPLLGGRAAVDRRVRAAAETRRQIYWYDVFCAFFAEELKVAGRVQAIFTAETLARISAGVPGLSPEQLQAAVQDALSQGLELQASGFCTQLVELQKAMERVSESQERTEELLSQLVEAQSVSQRDGLLPEIINRLDQMEQNASGRHEAVLRRFDQLEASGGFRRADVPFDLPPRPPTDLFGRDREREEVATALREGRHWAIVGDAGSGKTAVAAMAVRDVVGTDSSPQAGCRYPDGVLFLDCYAIKPGAQPEGDVNQLAWQQLVMVVAPGSDDKIPAETRVRQACQNKRMLLVIEGAELATGAPGHLNLVSLLKGLPHSLTTLILTRDHSQALDPATRTELSAALAPEAAKSLLRANPGANRLSSEQEVRLLGLLCGHPLALSWARGWLGASKSPQSLIDDWEAGDLPSLNNPDFRQRNQTLQWLYVRNVSLMDAQAKRVFDAAAMLAPIPFRLDAMSGILDVVQLESALNRLVELSVFTLQQDSAQTTIRWAFNHELAYRFAVAQGAANAAELLPTLADAQMKVMQGMLKPIQTLEFSDALSHLERLLGAEHTGALSHIADELRYGVSDALSDQHQLKVGQRVLELDRQWIVRTRATGRPALERELTINLNRSGDILVSLGQNNAAFSEFLQALAICERLSASQPDHAGLQRDVSVSLNKVGDVLVSQGRGAEALSRYEQSLAIFERLSASQPDHAGLQRDVSVSLDNVAGVLESQGRGAEALSRYERKRSPNDGIATG